jgi:hypothetical protein
MNQRLKDLQSFFNERFNLNINESEVFEIKDKMQEILSVQTYYEDDLTMEKGDQYLCIKDLDMANGEPRFVEGKTYDSPENGSLLNENGQVHKIPEKFIKVHFRKTKNLL